MPAKRSSIDSDSANESNEPSESSAKPGRGWHGDSEGHADAGRKGGRIAHQRGTAHRFTSEEAREAGKKGGRTSRSEGATATPAAPSPRRGRKRTT